MPDACEDEEGCDLVGSEAICVPDESGRDGGLFDACEFTNACDPGLVCTGASQVGCESSARCCTPWCDLQAPDCPGELVCTPAFDSSGAPELNADVGTCLLAPP